MSRETIMIASAASLATLIGACTMSDGSYIEVDIPVTYTDTEVQQELGRIDTMEREIEQQLNDLRLRLFGRH